MLKQRSRINENGNPQSTNTIDITIIWPDGAIQASKGLKSENG